MSAFVLIVECCRGVVNNLLPRNKTSCMNESMIKHLWLVRGDKNGTGKIP